MRILHVITNAELGGAQMVAASLAAAAVESGQEVGLAAMAEGRSGASSPRGSRNSRCGTCPRL